MTTYKEFFGSKYPILAAPMNQVSELGLALAVSKAGGIPSITAFNYYWGGGPQIHPPLLENLIGDITTFRKQTNNACLLLSIGINDLFNRTTVDRILSTGIKHFEVVSDLSTDTKESWEQTFEVIDYLKSNDCKVLLKTAGPNVLYKNVDGSMYDMPSCGNIDGFIIKGPAAAGRVSRIETPLLEIIKILRTKYPDKLIISSGGVGNSSQVKFFMEQGILAVGVGTLFAASTESIVSEATKLKMVEASGSDIQQLKGSTQNALIFKQYIKDDNNHTYSLRDGIRDPSKGHIFAGKSIINVTSIRPVDEIIQDLVKDL